MPIITRKIVGVTALLILCGAVAPAQDESISIGDRIKLHSELLNEDRTILVSLPPDYKEGRIRCPVVYLLDGDAHFLQTVAVTRFLAGQGLAPETIVAAIMNIDRARDFTPAPAVPDSEFPTAGGADRFRRFLTTELRPYLEARYRTEPYRILVGWSLGGLFAVHAMLSDPASFDAFITASPSLWWDNKVESAAAAKLFESGAELRKFLYLSHGRENNSIPESVQAFATVLGRKAPPSLRWKLDYLAGDNHGSVPARAIYNGLESLFSGWAIPEDGFPAAADLEKRYAALSKEFGFTCRPNEGMINGKAYTLLRTRKKVAEALDLFLYNVRCYPESANVHDSLADAYEAAGLTQLALESCRTACRLAEQAADPRLPTFRKHLASVEAKLGKEGRHGA
jgi:predicted alpha/beta superfamily hydrolase